MEGCKYCSDEMSDGATTKDIVFKFLKCNPFGIEDDHYNPDLSLYINEDFSTLELVVMLCDWTISKDEIKINHCPFCGRRLREDV